MAKGKSTMPDERQVAVEQMADELGEGDIEAQRYETWTKSAKADELRKQSGETRVGRDEGSVGALHRFFADELGEEKTPPRAFKPDVLSQMSADADVKSDEAEEDYKYLLADAARQVEQQYKSTSPMSAGLNSGPSGEQQSSGWGYSTPEAAQEASDIQALAAKARADLSGYMGGIAANVRSRGRQMSAQREALEGLSVGGEEEARRRVSLMQQAFDEADVDLASLRVDPKRWEEDTPAVAQVLMALASSAFAFFSGGQGPNPVVQLIDKAIDRDIKAQMVNMQNKLKSSQLGIEKQEVLGKMEGNLRAAMYQRVLNTMEGMSNETREEMAAMQIAQAAQGVYDSALQAEMARLEPYKVQYQNRSEFGGGGAGKQLTSDFIAKKAQSMAPILQGARLAGQVQDLIDEGGSIDPVRSSGFVNKIATLIYDDPAIAKSGDLKARIQSFATRMARATGVDVGNFAQSEAKRFIQAIEGRRWNIAKTTFNAIMESVADQVGVMDEEMKALAAARYNVAPLQSINKRAAEAYYEVAQRGKKPKRKKD